MMLPNYPAAASYPPGLFAETFVMTDRGEQMIETVGIGDSVMTAFARQHRVKWVGRRSFGRRFVAGKAALAPIRIATGALGREMPRRDLYVSPQQGIYLGGVLIPAWCLINGSTIHPVRLNRDLHYVQIEFETHEIILAEGAPVESYRAAGNRNAFHNASDYADRYPHSSAQTVTAVAPVIAGGQKLRAARAYLAARVRRERER